VCALSWVLATSHAAATFATASDSSDELWKAISKVDADLSRSGSIQLVYRIPKTDMLIVVIYDGPSEAFLFAHNEGAILRTRAGEVFVNDKPDGTLHAFKNGPRDNSIPGDSQLDLFLSAPLLRSLLRARLIHAVTPNQNGGWEIESKYISGTRDGSKSGPISADPKSETTRYIIGSDGRLLSSQRAREIEPHIYLYPENVSSPFGYVARVYSNRKGYELIDVKQLDAAPKELDDPSLVPALVRKLILRQAATRGLIPAQNINEPRGDLSKGAIESDHAPISSSVSAYQGTRRSWVFVVTGCSLVALGLLAWRRRRRLGGGCERWWRHLALMHLVLRSS